MKVQALVLTFDEQIGFAELLVKRYDALWPSHPFEFLIPFQDSDRIPSSLRDHPNCRLVRAQRNVRSSMAALLDGIDDHDWLFWAIDDRYPIQAAADQLDRL